MITQIWVNGQEVDVYSNTDIKFTYQVNDIAEVKDRQANYTNSFNLPRTANNIRIFQGLGEPSDSSTIPYNKIPCQLALDGFDLITKGWLNITETTDNEYKIHIYSGLINFFKEIESKNLSDLGLEITHNKTVQSVKDSVDNENYRYIWADYNGRLTTQVGSTTLNIDQLVPSVRVKYLFEKIHSVHNFIPQGNFMNDENFTNLWMTYTKGEGEGDYVEKLNSENNLYSVNNWNTSNPYDNNTYARQFTLKQPSGAVADRFVVQITGYYRFVINFDLTTAGGRRPIPEAPFYLYYIIAEPGEQFTGKLYDQIQNGRANSISFPIIDNQENRTWLQTTEPIEVKEGQNIIFFWYWRLNGVNISYDLDLKVEYKNPVLIDPVAELSDFKITDFLKEILNFFGLTMFYNENSNIIQYKTLKERIYSDNVVDWSEKYINRTSERYVYQSYAQNNIFEYKYSDDTFDFNNGKILVGNKNLEETKTVFKSKLFSPERQPVYFPEFPLTTTVPLFKIYDKEIDENKPVTDIDYIKYKPVSKRYFFLRSNILTGSWTIGSKNIPGTTVNATRLAYASFDRLQMSDIVANYYGSFTKILKSSRLHNIDLNLKLPDVLTLSFDRIYYFKQEQQYYFLNKLNFDEKKAKGEFVRIERAYTVVNISINYSDIICDDDVCYTTLDIKVGGDIPRDMKLYKLIGGVWTYESDVPMSNNISQSITLGTGSAFRIQYTDNKGDIGYSNTVNY